MISLLITVRHLIRSFFHAMRDKEFLGLLLLTLTTLLSGTIFYSTVEGFHWLDALYFSVTTLTTVGYGDLSPKTELGKVFTILYLFTGLGIIFGFVRKLTEARTNRKGEEDE
ncbi:potassium channel family protein [Brevibacillus brevis]|uniref:Potassium channel family protein n=1 Tax=Brevibacillus brevis TaxID=1393 RepID=A0ABY9TD96_BREBE|nr:potassium channel family protein [Brevibacillus brevis]WNC17489.1 potassium channel family protein [Brevibacillus brevis]